MPLDATSVFDRVEISCSCSNGILAAAVVRGGGPGDNTEYGYRLPEAIPNVGGAWDPENADVAEVIRRIKLGTCAVYFKDGGTRWLETETPQGLDRLRVHPFHATDGYKFHTPLIDHSHIVQDANTGRKDIEHEFGMVSTSRTPDGPTFNYPLEELIVLQDSNAVRFVLRWEPTEDYTDFTIENAPLILALKSWLRANLQSGTTIPADAPLIYDPTDVYEFERSEHRYQFMQDPDATEHPLARIVTFNATFSAGNYQSLDIVFGRTNLVFQDINLLNNLFDSATGTIPTVENIENPPFGTRGGGAVTVGSIQFDTVKITEVQGRLMAVGTDHLGARYAVPLEGNYGRMIDWSNLETIGTEATKKYAPRHHDTVIYNVSGLRSVRFRPTLQMVESNDTHRLIRFVNEQGQLDIEDRDGNRRFRLEKGETAVFLVLLHDTGVGGIINATPLPLRKQIISSGLIRDGNGAVAGELDTVPYLIKDAANFFRFIPMPTFVDSTHEDAFRIGSASIANGQDIRTYTGPWDTPWTVELLQSGKLTVTHDFELTAVTGWAGELQADLQLFRWEAALAGDMGTTVPIPFGRNEFNALEVLGQRRQFSISEQKDIAPGDIVFGGFIYDVGSTGVLSAGRVTSYQRTLTLETSINIRG